MLQIDMRMPNNCINCPLSYDYVCLVTDRYLDESLTGAYGEERPDWCPLKDPEEKTGYWIYLQDCANEGVYCSECHTKMFDHYPMKKKLSQFCAHCGAKMADELGEL